MGRLGLGKITITVRMGVPMGTSMEDRAMAEFWGLIR